MLDAAREVLSQTFQRKEAIENIYAEQNPTARTVLKLLQASPQNQAEIQHFWYFQQYIRGLDEVGLRKKMRFMTGADVICVKDRYHFFI